MNDRMMIGFKRVLSAPKLLVGLFSFQIALVALSTAPVRSATRAAIGKHDVLVDSHFLITTAELALTHPAWRSTFLGTPFIIGIAGFLFWQLASAGNLSRLARPIDLGTWASECIRFALPMLMIRAYLGVLQIVLVVPTLLVLPKLAFWSKLFLLCFTTVLLAASVFLQDISRAKIVIHQAARYHPRTLYFGILSLLRNPGASVIGIALSCSQWGISIALLYWSTQNFHESSTLWFARLFSLVPLFVGLWRMALAIEISTDRKLES